MPHRMNRASGSTLVIPFVLVKTNWRMEGEFHYLPGVGRCYSCRHSRNSGRAGWLRETVDASPAAYVSCRATRPPTHSSLLDPRSRVESARLRFKTGVPFSAPSSWLCRSLRYWANVSSCDSRKVAVPSIVHCRSLGKALHGTHYKITSNTSTQMGKYMLPRNFSLIIGHILTHAALHC